MGVYRSMEVAVGHVAQGRLMCADHQAGILCEFVKRLFEAGGQVGIGCGLIDLANNRGPPAFVEVLPSDRHDVTSSRACLSIPRQTCGMPTPPRGGRSCRAQGWCRS